MRLGPQLERASVDSATRCAATAVAVASDTACLYASAITPNRNTVATVRYAAEEAFATGDHLLGAAAVIIGDADAAACAMRARVAAARVAGARLLLVAALGYAAEWLDTARAMFIAGEFDAAEDAAAAMFDAITAADPLVDADAPVAPTTSDGVDTAEVATLSAEVGQLADAVAGDAAAAGVSTQQPPGSKAAVAADVDTA